MKHVQDLNTSLQDISNIVKTLQARGAMEDQPIASIQERLEMMTGQIADLQEELRQVASDSTVIKLNPELIRQPRVVHMGKIHTC